jgi:alpha-beta hydrolase superfamily lysophospholipase
MALPSFSGVRLIESLVQRASAARELVYGLTRAGFAVMRSEKSGVGDSSDTPCRDVDFRREVSLFTSGLKKLTCYNFVDTENVFFFVHSVGGWIAPLVASEEPVKGIVAYGTVVRPFATAEVKSCPSGCFVAAKEDGG